MRKFSIWFAVLLVLLAPIQAAVGAINVVTHNSDATLVDGLNQLLSGTDFLLPSAQQGGHYLIVNESGQPVNIIPGAEGLSVGGLPAGHQGVLDNGMQLEVIDIGQNRYYLWKGSVTDGGDYYVVVNPEPNFSITPSVANFGSVLQGNSQDLVLQVSNLGTADLTLGDIALLDPLNVPFELVAAQDSCSNQTLAASDSCTFAVRFSPQNVGDFSDSFDIPSNDPDTASAIISVTGTGTLITVTYAQTDFSGNALGSGLPTGWTERWETGSASFAVVDSSVFSGTKDLVATSSSGARRLITLDAADGMGPDVELLMLFSDPVNEGSNHTDLRMMARAGGGPGTETAYFFTTNNSQNQVAIYKYVNGVLSPLAGGDEKIPFNNIEPWWVRLRVEGTSLKLKMWPHGSVEPGDWQLATVDSEITEAGWQGLGNYWIGDHVFHEFVVYELPGTANPVNGFGITPVTPITVNLDAETGNTTGWVAEFGELRVTSNYKRSGSYGFQGGPADYRAYQRIDLAQSGITQQQLNQGAKFSFRAWQRALTWNNDPGRIGLRFLDASQAEISSVYTDWDYKNATFVPKGLIKIIPANAAFVDIILEGQLKSGSAGAYFDDLEAAIGVKQ